MDSKDHPVTLTTFHFDGPTFELTGEIKDLKGLAKRISEIVCREMAETEKDPDDG